MKAESRPLAGSLELLGEIDTRNLFLATLNNESRDLNDHRIATLGLWRYFQTLLSSCYVGVKKPEQEIYELAFAVTQGATG